MLADAPVTAFVATADPGRARAFYEDVLGLPFVADEPFALIFRLAGASLRVAKVERLEPAPYTVLGFNVPDIALTLRELETRGASFERYPRMGQDERGVCTFPGGARVAWFKDPDGNTLSITEHPG